MLVFLADMREIMVVSASGVIVVGTCCPLMCFGVFGGLLLGFHHEILVLCLQIEHELPPVLQPLILFA